MKDCTVIAYSPLDAPLAIAAFQEKILERHNPDKIRYCSSIEAAHCLVGAGLGIALLPGMLCLKAPEYVCVPVDGAAELSFGVFYHEDRKRAHADFFIRQMSGTE